MSDVKIYTKNMLATTNKERMMAKDVIKMDPDIACFQEVNRDNNKIIRFLEQVYPYHYLDYLQVYREGKNGGLLIVSKTPLTHTKTKRGAALISAKTTVRGNELTICNLHFTPSWKDSRLFYKQVSHAVRYVSHIHGLKFVAGDFNNTVQEHALTAFQNTGVKPIYDYKGTVRHYGIEREIDFVLVPNGWTGEKKRRALLGSDHYGVFVKATSNP
ncbi:MAG: endonuclease/exonuclease/phosphatase family protein [Gammaproteobacteria bacterium]|nr:MAG: endonuclease/exonuclease/phosphatase family protein [Gammaproteobacteria bacterium]